MNATHSILILDEQARILLPPPPEMMELNIAMYILLIPDSLQAFRC